MFVEYMRILGKGGNDLESHWQLMGKLGLIVGVGLINCWSGISLDLLGLQVFRKIWSAGGVKNAAT
jgi:hypothetical protein